MQFNGAVIREQNVTFAIVVVKPHVIHSKQEAENALQSFGPVFGGIPIVLMAQDNRGRPAYLGRPDISRFLSRVPIHRIPWKKYTLN